MVKARGSIFRDTALQQYAHGMEKDVLPRIATPPVFICLWALLGLLIAATLTAWLGQVPEFVTGSGIMQAQQGSNNIAAVVFLPANAFSKVRTGQTVQVQLAATGQQFTGTIDNVGTGIISPAEAQQQYHLGGAGPQVAPGPSVVVTVVVSPSIPRNTYEGSIIYAQAQIGSERILSLLPGINALIGVKS